MMLWGILRANQRHTGEVLMTMSFGSSIVLAWQANSQGRGDLATPARLSSIVSSIVLTRLANNKDKG